MKKNIKSAVVYFLVGLLVMQVIFNGGEKVGAAHSATGTITHINGVRCVQEAGTNRLSPCYCISRALSVGNGDQVTSDMSIDAAKAYLLNCAVLSGFHTNNIQGTQVDKRLYDDTQVLVWDIIEGRFDGTLASSQALGHHNATIADKVIKLAKTPTYVNSNENELTWNTCTNQFELVLTNTDAGANEYVKVDATSLPAGVQVVAEGENLKITSANEYTTTQTVKIYKSLNEKGKIVAWDNGGGSKQPQITLDYDEDPVAKVFELKIKTGIKPAVAPQPEQPAPQQPEQPAPEQPAPQPEQNQEPVVEEEVKLQENTLSELDEVPATGDETDLTKVFIFLGAAVISMVGVGVTNVVKKRKNRM